MHAVSIQLQATYLYSILYMHDYLYVCLYYRVQLADSSVLPCCRYDSLTGLPSCQRTMAFEKASVLFNTAALHSQLGAREDRTSQSGLDATIGHYLRAAGIYRWAPATHEISATAQTRAK